jgi:RND family efflux transporter MFP subunit
MNQKIYLLITATIFVASCGNKANTYTPEYKSLTEAVYASGMVLPQNEYQVMSMGDGILVDILIKEGDYVKKDQPLFRIKSETMDARFQNAVNIYKVAQNNYSNQSPVLNELNSVLKVSREKLKNDSVYFSKAKILFEKNAISKNDYDKASLSFISSENDYNAKLQVYNRTKDQLYLELKNAESQFIITQEDKNNYLIRSYIDGMVYEVYKEPGETARRNEPLALIADASKVYIQLDIDEEDITKIKVGQEVLVKMDIYRGQIFRARINKVYPRLQVKNQSFRVDAYFTDSIPPLYSGITAEANIIIQEKERALVVPKSYLVNEDSLWIKQNGKKIKVKVKKGAENYEWVEVLEGLTENTKVLQP